MLCKANWLKCLLLVFSMGLASCHLRTWSSQKSAYAIIDVKADSTGVDSVMLALITPYKDSIQKKVGQVVGFSKREMKKALPESALGNLLADMLLEQADGYFGAIDFAMLNYGGIRAALPADTVRRGHLMEILPFQNFVAVVEMDGKLTQQFLNHWAAKGGTPVSAVRFAISEGVATSVRIKGQAIDPVRTYRVVMPDYVANGGDGCAFLQSATTIEVSRLLLFDVVLAAFNERYQKGVLIDAAEDGRVYHK